MANMGATKVAELERRFSGEVVVPGGPRYDELRKVWNAAVDRRPAVIARCSDAEDVVVAIRWAHENDVLVAVRCGAHSVAGLSTCDGGIVIDLSAMNGVVVDPEQRTATVQGGALLGALDAAAQEHGLASPTGVVSHTGVGGLTLGGGIGRLSRAHGLSVDNILSLDVVTTDGRQIRVNGEEEPELFWAMRGAGPNFGIVTSFTLGLSHIGETMFAGMLVYPLERVAEITEVFTAWAAHAPRIAAGKITLARLGDGPPIPDELAGRPVAVVGAGAIGTGEQAEAAVRALREHGPLLDLFGPRPYLGLQTMNDDVMGWGRRYYWKGLFVDELTPAAMEQAAGLIEDAPSTNAEVGAFTLGGAIGDVPEDAMAFSGRSARFWQSVEIDWEDAGDDDACIAWGRKSIAGFSAFTTGRNYVNDLNEPAADAVRDAYGREKYERLVAAKRQWDPDNVLRLNQNIRP